MEGLDEPMKDERQGAIIVGILTVSLIVGYLLMDGLL